MVKGEEHLDDLNQRIKFLKKEKQKIIDSRQARAEVKRLEDDIKALSNLDQLEAGENLTDWKAKFNRGAGLIKEIVSELRNSENGYQQKDASQCQKQEHNVILENEIETARKIGSWAEDEKKIFNDAISDELEEKWKIHKASEAVKSKKKAEKADKDAEVGLLGCLGVLAWFFPFFWPFLIVQLFRTYPGPCYTILGVIVFLVIVMMSAGS